ncbi:restriction endonuclease subunit S [Jejuia pallidilutea]|uniref:DNA methylase-type I restriction-modification system n=1 Tax=Jejuia pallidilutea TaxID=504487 RepID=A0A090W8X1_9FLAO|nr:restriction endonuclease subunit S [Jejuia pallidilutea]GAL73401.1 DNA methylase-type I restriction-modification system [Jejuia pallidilutea]
MIKVVESCNSREIAESGRFDVKYFYLGEILDKILKNFDVSPLINYTKFIKKGIFDLNSRFYRTSGIPFIRISNLKSFSIDESSMVYIPLKNHQKEIKTKLVPGDLALSKVGKYLGKIGQIPLRYDEVNISQNIVGVSFDCSDEVRKYIFLYLTTPIAINQIIRVSKAHNQNKLTLPDIRNLRIPMLSNEKVRIYANYVDDITNLENDTFVDLEKLKNELSNELGLDTVSSRKSLTYTSSLSFFRKDSFFTPEYSNPLYNDIISYLNENFETVSLGEICSIIKGDEVGSANYNVYTEKGEDHIPFIRTTDIVNNEIDNYPDFYIDPDIYNELNQDIKEGDIIFSNDGKIGQVAMVTDFDKVIVQSHFRRIRLNDDLNEKYSTLTQEYLFLMLSLEKIGIFQSKKFTVIQSTIPTISNNLSQFIIPILPVNRIVELTEKVKEIFKMKSDRKKFLTNQKQN